MIAAILKTSFLFIPEAAIDMCVLNPHTRYIFSAHLQKDLSAPAAWVL